MYTFLDMDKIVVWLHTEDKKNLQEKKELCCNGMSDSELGKRAIQQYLDIRMTLKDKNPGAFYIVYK